MRKFALGDLATIEDILKFVPKGMELSFNTGTKIKYDLDFYNSSPENHKNYANTYFTSHFPSLTFIPGYLWRNLSTKQHLEGAWSCATSFRVSKLPSVVAIKRKPL